MVYFANLCVNPSAIGFTSGDSRAGLQDRLCDVARHVSAQPLDFLDLDEMSSFLNWKLIRNPGVLTPEFAWPLDSRIRATCPPWWLTHETDGCNCSGVPLKKRGRLWRNERYGKMRIGLATGFKTAGIAAGIKKNSRKDLGIIVSDVPANVAGVFTRNRIQAAPVQLDIERIRSGICRAIIANSGNANCCTDDQGIEDARAMARFAATELGISEDQVLVASTGVIGEPLPIDRIRDAVPDLVGACRSGGIDDFSRAIMTTDTVPKVVSKRGVLQGKSYTVTGVAKGAGMIRPDMATLLAFVCTDIAAESKLLKEMLTEANDGSFNRISIDGDTSTNDTVLLMANGLSGVRVSDGEDRRSFQNILNSTLLDLAKMIVRDGEGATKMVEIKVKKAHSDSDARTIADTVAHSNLVKTALFGEDANWGRIIAAAGRAGVPIEPDMIDIFFGDVQMVKNGTGCGKAIEAEATEVLKTPEFTISIGLNMGTGSASVLTCDFSIDYVKINADYRS